MEYIGGVTLRDLVAKQRLSADAAVFIVSRLALILDYVHCYAEQGGSPLGLVHRDLKPSNLMLSRSGQLKLLDFGIAKATQRISATRGNVLKGSYAYMSPEQLTGDPLDARSDIFSIGSLLYELLTGRRAFDAESVHETMRRVGEVEVIWPPELDQAYVAIVGRCLRRNKDERWENALELYQALSALPCEFGPLDQRALFPS
jgi:serine/threonine-protein kinase